MTQFDISVNVKLYLIDGTVTERTLNDRISGKSRDAVTANLPPVISEIIFDWGSNLLESPLDDFKIVRVNYVRETETNKGASWLRPERFFYETI